MLLTKPNSPSLAHRYKHVLLYAYLCLSSSVLRKIQCSYMWHIYFIYLLIYQSDESLSMMSLSLLNFSLTGVTLTFGESSDLENKLFTLLFPLPESALKISRTSN